MSDAPNSANLASVAEFQFEARVRAEIDRRTAVTPAMLQSADEAGNLISVSDAWLSKLGYSRDEVLGRRFTDFLTPPSRERAIRETLPNLLRVGRCENIHYQVVKRGGGVIDVSLSAVLAEDLFGHGRISLEVMTDITALTEAKRLLAEANCRLHTLSEQDELTGLASRRAFDEGLSGEYERARRDDGSLAVIMIKIDGFKAFNNLYGEPAGDNCLKLIAGAIAGAVRRAGDITARYDGDEFAVVLPGAEEAGAISVAGRIQQAVRRLALEHRGNEGGIATVTMGVAATWPATSTEVQAALVQDALRILDASKKGRGNTIFLASSADIATSKVETVTSV